LLASSVQSEFKLLSLIYRNMSDTEDHDTSQQPLVSKDGEVKDKPPDQHPGSPNEADGDIVDTEDGETDRYITQCDQTK
jgi:hypothetical protein